MGRASTGRWYQDVARVAGLLGDVVTGPQLTAALMRDRDSLSLPMARRMSSAYVYASAKSDGAVIASIAVCEQLQVVERLDPTAIADLIGPALAGRVPLSVIQARAASTRARLSAAAADTMTPADLVDLCPEWEEPGLRRDYIEYDQIRDSDRVVVDAAAYDIEPVKLPDRWTIDYDARWCMLLSPHITCAKIKDPSHNRFVDRVLMALVLYARVSVICSSRYELGMLERELRRPRVWTRVWLHLPVDPGARSA